MRAAGLLWCGACAGAAVTGAAVPDAANPIIPKASVVPVVLMVPVAVRSGSLP